MLFGDTPIFGCSDAEIVDDNNSSMRSDVASFNRRRLWRDDGSLYLDAMGPNVVLLIIMEYGISAYVHICKIGSICSQRSMMTDSLHGL
jgi:hypothetical protein